MGQQTNGRVSSRTAVYDGESLKCLLFSLKRKIHGLVPVNGNTFSIRQLGDEYILEANQFPVLQLIINDGSIELKGKMSEGWQIQNIDHDTYLSLFKDLNKKYGGVLKI